MQESRDSGRSLGLFSFLLCSIVPKWQLTSYVVEGRQEGLQLPFMN